MSHRSRKKKKRHNNVPITSQKSEVNMANAKEQDLDKIFCIMGKKYGLDKLYLKAIGIVESNLNPKAYRFEPAFWDRYLKNNPEWQNRKPELVSASHGLMQIMLTTAWSLGLRTQPDEKLVEDLQNPVINIELAAKLLRQIMGKVACNKTERLDVKYKLHPEALCAARYNGGSSGNPREDGTLRNQNYVDKVFSVWHNLIKTEKECDETNSTP